MTPEAIFLGGIHMLHVSATHELMPGGVVLITMLRANTTNIQCHVAALCSVPSAVMSMMGFISNLLWYMLQAEPAKWAKWVVPSTEGIPAMIDDQLHDVADWDSNFKALKVGSCCTVTDGMTHCIWQQMYQKLLHATHGRWHAIDGVCEPFSIAASLLRAGEHG